MELTMVEIMAAGLLAALLGALAYAVAVAF